jgi:anaerobic magnesium-protoporphyrin IX monomethyl ester cyclase
MRILLINPYRSPARSSNLSLGYLAEALRVAGHAVDLADLSQVGWSVARLRALIRERAASLDLVGLQAYSGGYSMARRVANEVRALAPHAHVVLGGRHASALPQEVLAEEAGFDSVLVGEGERSFPQMVARLSEGGADALTGAAGVAVRLKGEIHQGPASPLPDLDELPIPAWDLIAPSLYPKAYHGGFVSADPVASMITTRGCPYHCTFCGSRLSGKELRRRSPETVAEEVRLLTRRHGVRELQIVDDNFTLKKEHALTTLEAIQREAPGLALSFPNGIRLDRLDDDLLVAMRAAGCYSLTVGIDSGSQQVLTRLERRQTLEHMHDRLVTIKALGGIRVTGNFILGLPDETAADIQRTIDYALSLPLDRANFVLFMPFPGSTLFDELRARGALDQLDWDTLRDNAPGVPFVPDGMTAAELQGWLWRAHLRFYGRPNVLRGLAAEVRGFQHTWHLAVKAFARLVAPMIRRP